MRRVRHVKRGTKYDVIGEAELQMARDLADGATMIVYRGDDGRLWVREEGEFEDGRFEETTPKNKKWDRVIDDMLAAQSRFAMAWRDGKDLTYQQKEDSKIRDARREEIYQALLFREAEDRRAP